MPTQCGCIVSIGPETVWVARVYSETSNRIEVLSRRVQEGRGVMEASEFCRWLLFSGIIQVLEQTPNPGPLKVDGAHLRWKVEELLSVCNSRLRSGPDGQPCLTAGYLQSLHDKVDLVAGYLSRLSVSTAVSVNSLEASQQTSELEPLATMRNGLPARSAGGPLA